MKAEIVIRSEHDLAIIRDAVHECYMAYRTDAKGRVTSEQKWINDPTVSDSAKDNYRTLVLAYEQLSFIGDRRVLA